jgi:hypothetical protein
VRARYTLVLFVGVVLGYAASASADDTLDKFMKGAEIVGFGTCKSPRGDFKCYRVVKDGKQFFLIYDEDGVPFAVADANGALVYVVADGTDI